MSEKFSVEDILNEVNSMTGDYYYNNSGSSVKAESPFKNTGAEFDEAKKADTADKFDEAYKLEKAEKSDENDENNKSDESFLPIDIDESDENDESDEFEQKIKAEATDFDISKMSTEDFFKMLEIDLDYSSKKSKAEKKLIKQEEQAESSVDKETNIEQEPTAEIEEENSIKVADKKAEPEATSTEKATEHTVVFDKNALKKSVQQSQDENKQEKQENQEKQQEKLETKPEAMLEEALQEEPSPSLLGDLKPKTSHKPQHLLKPEEIINNSMNKAPSFRFSDMVKDLTKPKNKQEQNSEILEKDLDLEKDIEKDIEKDLQADLQEIPQESLQNNSKIDSPIDVIDEISEQFELQEKENARPDVLNNKIELENEDKNNFANQEGVFEKQIDDSELDLNKAPNRAYAKKTMRRITEASFDYSEDNKNDDDVIDDYSSIEDEEPVKQDLDLSVKKISKRLSLNIIAFVISFLFGVLPQFDIELIGAISPSENLTGFYIFNAAILFLALIINIKSFFRGIGSLLTLKPDADSPCSVASLLVIATAVVPFVPSLADSASKVSFFTSTLIFSYILSLIGKKSMVTRIKSNFRLVATSNPKQACFIADERFSEMLENDDFIGYPEVATSKSVINLHNYLKNSYCDDPSDNLSRVFSPLAVLVALAAFAVTYIMSADVVLSLFYSTAAALLCVPASAVLAVNAPLKKACHSLRHKEGLISGYNAIEEFANVDCVAIDADDLFPAGAVELKSIRAIGDASIEDVILKSAALTINAGGPLADVFDKIIDGRRKMLPPISDIVYEDGLGLTGKIEGKVVRVGNRKLIDSYGIYGLFDDSLEQKAKNQGFFIVYTAVDDEVCGMFVVKYKSFYADIADALYELIDNNITIAVKTNDPNITPQLIEQVFDIPSDCVVLMQAHTAEHYDELTKPAKNGDSILAFNGNSSTLAMLITACKKLQKKISLAVLLQSILTVLGFCACLLSIVLQAGTEFITPINIIGYQFATAIISHIFPSLIKRIK